MLLKVSLLCFGIALHAIQAFDYRWESYFGTVPEDAISVDTDDGKIYIGQGATGLGICIGVVRPNVLEIELNCVEYFNITDKRHTNGYIKILCADHKERYVWKPANSETFLKILDMENFVYSGRMYLTNVNVWVGRYAPPNGNPPMVFGNIEDGIFNYAANGKPYTVTDSYEALVYVPEEEKPPCSDLIKEGVNAATEGQIAIDCIATPMPSEIDPSQTQVEPNPPETTTVG